ncbi:alpha/beta hydrolase-fold protein [Akkermansiaceae bacterium]|nr:alpha/beta hydrolase-fold protein [Akkermansiaceae bacterium]MDB4544583.1 alpha/beta hydrolase-fold protein [Akkermansiaceae bacterium]
MFRSLSLFLSVIAVAVASPGQQVESSLKIDENTVVSYLQYLPEDFDENDQSKQWPLMLFLHGRGESNGPLSGLKKWGPCRLIKEGKKFPFIIISPQCPKTSWWSNDDQQQILEKLLAEVQKQFPIDQSRIYLTGLSMGGFGSWELAARNPKTFAAVLPICGGGNIKNGPKLIDIPIWAWHGTADKIVPFSKSSDMVLAVKRAGGNTIKFTKLVGVGHVSWPQAYNDPKVWEWLTQQKRNTK